MAQGTFKRVGKSKKQMYGPRCIMVCGYQSGEQSSLLYLLEQNGFEGLPVIFVTDDYSAKSLKEISALNHKAGLWKQSNMKRAIIMSGFTQKELYKLMAIYRLSEMPSPFWATLTPISENWSISQLLDELAAESEAMKRHKEDAKSETEEISKGEFS